MTLNARQLTAIVKAGLIVANDDGKMKDEEHKVIINELKHFEVNQEVKSILLDAANGMTVETMVDLLKNLSYDEKKYVSGFLVAVMLSDKQLGNDEPKVWQSICTLCEFPDIKAEHALWYWENH